VARPPKGARPERFPRGALSRAGHWPSITLQHAQFLSMEDTFLSRRFSSRFARPLTRHKFTLTGAKSTFVAL
jgi:hypothetical protein